MRKKFEIIGAIKLSPYRHQKYFFLGASSKKQTFASHVMPIKATHSINIVVKNPISLISLI